MAMFSGVLVKCSTNPMECTMGVVTLHVSKTSWLPGRVVVCVICTLAAKFWPARSTQGTTWSCISMSPWARCNVLWFSTKNLIPSMALSVMFATLKETVTVTVRIRQCRGMEPYIIRLDPSAIWAFRFWGMSVSLIRAGKPSKNFFERMFSVLPESRRNRIIRPSTFPGA